MIDRPHPGEYFHLVNPNKIKKLQLLIEELDRYATTLPLLCHCFAATTLPLLYHCSTTTLPLLYHCSTTTLPLLYRLLLG